MNCNGSRRLNAVFERCPPNNWLPSVVLSNCLAVILVGYVTVDLRFPPYSWDYKMMNLNQQQTITNTNDNNQDAVRQRLSGAARKRYHFFLKKGFSVDEARMRATKPMQPLTQPIQTITTTQRLPVQSRLGAPVRRTPVHNPDTSLCLNLAILPGDYPSELWSIPQLEAVQQSIIDLIRRQDLNTIKPKFSGCTFRQGWLSVNCNDSYTVDWLRAMDTRLRPWEGASLQVIPESEVPFKRIFIGIFPALETSSLKYSLQLIDEQNVGLTVMDWRVIYRGQQGPHMKLIISIDSHSAEVIRKRGYLLNYGFSSVRFKPMELAK